MDTATQQGGRAHPSSAEIEATVLALWRDAFQRETIAPDEDFHALGGDSLAATVIAAAAEDAFGVQVGAGEVYASPTPAAFAECVAQKLSEA